MINEHWKYCGASVRGTGHVQTGVPCQDSFQILDSRDGKWVALVACDGAGTASRSKEGAEIVSKSFAYDLIKLAVELDKTPPGAWVTDRVIEAIVRTRNELRRVADGDDISQYHCTLVSALIGPAGGFSIHLGDGAVFGGALSPREINTIDLSNEYFVSQPENGEYANETVFLTERDWIKKLRIHPIGRVDWIMLGTDGGMALAMKDEKQPKSGFVLPVLSNLSQSTNKDNANKLLLDALSDPKADRLTNDDKTLAIAMRREIKQIQGEFEINDDATTVMNTRSNGASKDIYNNLTRQGNLAILDNDLTLKKLKKKLLGNINIYRVIGVSVVLSAIAVSLIVFIYKDGIFRDKLEPKGPIGNAVLKSGAIEERSQNIEIENTISSINSAANNTNKSQENNQELNLKVR